MLNQDYRDMLSALNANGVEFLVVGAYALAVHGYPRVTADMDIFIRPSRENAKRLFTALAEFGAPLEQVSPADFEAAGTVLQIGVKPRRIDILTGIDGLSFDEAAEGCDVVDVDGVRVPVISKVKCVINKRSTGREKDRLDAEELERGSR